MKNVEGAGTLFIYSLDSLGTGELGGVDNFLSLTTYSLLSEDLLSPLIAATIFELSSCSSTSLCFFKFSSFNLATSKYLSSSS